MLILKSTGSERTKKSNGMCKGSLCCKTEFEDHQSLKTIRVWRPSEADS